MRVPLKAKHIVKCLLAFLHLSGFKNGTDGGLTVATNAMQSVKHGHSFLGLSDQGQVSVIRTSGNPYAHVVLRGGNGKPNYDAGSVADAEAALAKAKVSGKIMIDTSHANSKQRPVPTTPCSEKYY